MAYSVPSIRSLKRGLARTTNLGYGKRNVTTGGGGSGTVPTSGQVWPRGSKR